MKLDPDPQDFRAAAHAAVDWIADYLENIDSFPVLSRVQPGDIQKQFAAGASEEGKAYSTSLDFKILLRTIPAVLPGKGVS